MSVHVAPPTLDDDDLYRLAGRRPAIDLLAQGIEYVRARLAKAERLPQRVQIFCAGLSACRNLGSADVVHTEFYLLASDAGLLAELTALPPFTEEAGFETLDHLIRFTWMTKNGH
jgi:hypothetical protein